VYCKRKVLLDVPDKSRYEIQLGLAFGEGIWVCVHRTAKILAFLLLAISSSACSGGGASSGSLTSPALPAADVGSETTLAKKVKVVATPTPKPVATAPPVTKRGAFVGAFYRPQGPPPFGVFLAQSPGVAPQPYPAVNTNLVGAGGYCSAVAQNGYSIDSGYVVDPTKLADITTLGVRWTRMPASQFNDDLSHVFGPGVYAFSDLDSAQCNTLGAHGIKPVIGLEAGPVQYGFPPQQVPLYQTAGDFGQWCGAVATHERKAFPSVTQFSLPGNEVNTNLQMFPGGAAQLAAYSEACYAAIKAANPSAFVYGFELNMDGQANAPGFVRQMYALGCKVGTCYDGLALHLTLRYPIPPASTPCYPNPGGDYSLQCITDIQTAAQAPVHVLISESVYPVPGAVPDEATKALAVVAAYTAYAAVPSVDGVAYANVDECAFYPSGFFYDGCLIDTSGAKLPAYGALEQLTTANFL
jgi:hypothetical protein